MGATVARSTEGSDEQLTSYTYVLAPDTDRNRHWWQVIYPLERTLMDANGLSPDEAHLAPHCAMVRVHWMRGEYDMDAIAELWRN